MKDKGLDERCTSTVEINFGINIINKFMIKFTKGGKKSKTMIN